MKNNFNVALLLLILAFGGCSGSSTKKTLSGERISIIADKTDLIPDSDIKDSPVILPNEINYKDWTQFGAFADHSPLHLKLPDLVRKSWKRSIGPSLNEYQSFLTPPIVHNEVVYSLNIKNELYAVNAKNGRVLWKKKLKSQLKNKQVISSGSIAIDGKTIIALLGSGEVYSIDILTKEILWQKNLNQALRSAPVIHNGIILVKALNNKLFALDIQSGELQWSHSGVHEPLTSLGSASPAVSKNIVVVSYIGGEIFGLDLNTGAEIWVESSNSKFNFELSNKKLSNVYPPVIVGRLAFIVNAKGTISALEITSGTEIWSKEISTAGHPWVAGNSIFITTKENKLACLQKSTGKVVWVLDLEENILKNLAGEDKKDAAFTAPILAGKRIIIASNKGFVASIKPKDGTIKKVDNIKQPITVSPIVADKTIYFLSNNSNIIAYN